MNPMMVEVTRGGIVESEHRVHVAIASHDGIEIQGDGERLTFPRSAAKLMQALPLVESGAAHRAGLTPEQLALACASHGGESAHVNAVEAWLTQLGLTEPHLECGPSWPMHEPSGHTRSAQGLGASLLCNCCSGKHAGFMTLAKDQGVDVEGYIQREHPVQQQIEATIGEVLDTPVGVFGVDGCGIPTYANRLMDLANGLHRLASATGVRGDAVKTLAAAHRAHPFMVGGTDRCCTDINGALADGMVKYGAEGVYFGLFPKAGLGIAMKAECGTVRAVEAAMVRVLKQHRLLPADALPQWDSVSLKNRAGLVVGEVRA